MNVAVPRSSHQCLMNSHLTRITNYYLLITALLASCATPSPAAESASLAATAFETAPPPEVQTEAPLRFVLPSPGAEPVSGWRPPLYPVPWAVTSYDHFYFTRPNPADQVNWPLPDYRYGGIFFENEIHTGIDIDADLGSPVLAAGPGTVIWAGGGFYTGVQNNTTDPYGLAVSIRHDFGFQGKPLYTIYAHMSRVDVTEGQHVEAGEQIGLVGETGRATGPHLHFEVRLEHNLYHHTLNPELWLAPPQGWGVLVGQLHQYNGLLLETFPVRVISEETGRVREVRTYGSETINADPYYQENMVLSDLPAGLYRVSLIYDGRDHQFWVEILPGQVTYFTYIMYGEFKTALPPTPALDFVPMTPTPTPTKRP